LRLKADDSAESQRGKNSEEEPDSSALIHHQSLYLPPRDGCPYFPVEKRPELWVPEVQCRPRCPSEKGVEQRVEVSLGTTDRREEKGMIVELQ